MNKRVRLTILCLAVLFLTSIGCAEDAVNFTVSMEPAANTYDIQLSCAGQGSDSVDFKLPAWSPGYYRVIGFSKNIKNFTAKDGQGNELKWEKDGDNVWRVAAGDAKSIVLNYQVLARGSSVAEGSLNETKGFLTGTSTFMYIDGKLNSPAVVKVTLPENFASISTGLDPVEGEKNTYSAVDFDTLYDCPIYMGNPNISKFEHNSIAYTVAIEGQDDVDTDKLASILTRIVDGATTVVGEVPYSHYSFIFMGRGMGGLEHSNSMAVFSTVPDLATVDDGWLSFVAHEYFHLYNIKRIRPITLGPFDYDKANKTNMLWFSEGGTVYYEYIILNRAGFMDSEEALAAFSKPINKYESSPANKTMTVATASYDTWTLPFFGGDDVISYYDKGVGVCIFLDLKIRHETNNEKSMDDVMKVLYYKYHKGLKRGFTDEEFQAESEKLAGCKLDEIFEYVYTTKAMDYDKYLGYAGLKLQGPIGGQRGGYKIVPVENPSDVQKKTLASWLQN